jgi:hypothetical protein
MVVEEKEAMGEVEEEQKQEATEEDLSSLE